MAERRCVSQIKGIPMADSSKKMYRSGEIEQAFDKYLEGASDTAKKLFKVYAIP